MKEIKSYIFNPEKWEYIGKCSCKRFDEKKELTGNLYKMVDGGFEMRQCPQCEADKYNGVYKDLITAESKTIERLKDNRIEDARQKQSIKDKERERKYQQ